MHSYYFNVHLYFAEFADNLFGFVSKCLFHLYFDGAGTLLIIGFEEKLPL